MMRACLVNELINSIHRLDRALGIHIAIFVGLTFAGSIAFGAVEDSRFTVAPGGTSVDFEVRDVPRRIVLERLFAGRALQVEWLNATVADDSISGNFRGGLPSVARALLARLDFVLIYDETEVERRLTRIIIVGRGSSRASAHIKAVEKALQALEGKPAHGFAPEKKGLPMNAPRPEPSTNAARAAPNLPMPLPRGSSGRDLALGTPDRNRGLAAPVPVGASHLPMAVLGPGPAGQAMPSAGHAPGAIPPFGASRSVPSSAAANPASR